MYADVRSDARIPFQRACAVTAVTVLAGCGGGEGETLDTEAVADGDRAAIVRGLRLSGGLVERTTGMRTFPGCQPAKFTASAETLVNVTVATRVWRPGRYAAQLQPMSYHFRYRQEGPTCQKPDGTWEVRPAYGDSGDQPVHGRQVLLVYDGTHVEIRGGLFGDVPACTGENLLRGEDVGLANPMMTLTGVTRCAYPGFTVTTRTSVRLVGTF
jgi:hypothetical protein